MNKIKKIYLILTILIGMFLFIFGGYDDSLGGQLLGLIIIAIGVVSLIKNMKKTLTLLLFILIPLLIGAGSSLLVTQNQSQTYANLIQPSFAPPGWLFGPVWTFLYICMGVASWLIWREKDNPVKLRHGARKTALKIYIVQLILNFFWTGIFFGLGQFGWALIELSILWILILINCRLFWRIKTWAGILLLPYILWVTFAGVLNFFIWQLN